MRGERAHKVVREVVVSVLFFSGGHFSGGHASASASLNTSSVDTSFCVKEISDAISQIIMQNNRMIARH